MKRFGAISIGCLLLLLMGIPTAVPVSAYWETVATEEDVILLAASDFQAGDKTTQIEGVLDVLYMHGLTQADGAFFVGDYTLEQRDDGMGNTSVEESSRGIATLKELFSPIVGDNMIFTQGNHDHKDTVGLAADGNNDPASGQYGVFVINEDQRMEFSDASSYEDTLQAANDLKAYLDDKVAAGWTKPIFVLNHIGLHWGNRTILQGVGVHAHLLVDVLNEAGEQGLNIIYLYGHNHSSGYDDWLGGGAVYFKKGDQIPVATGSKKKEDTKLYTLNFTYMNAGYIGYYSTTEPTADATITMSVFLIRGDEVIITRYDREVNFNKNKIGVHPLKSPGVWHPEYSREDYHATPNLLEYASSRRVTATEDEPVGYPRYSPIEVEEPQDATTTTPPTTATTLQTYTTTHTALTTTSTPTVPTTTSNDTSPTVSETSADGKEGGISPQPPPAVPWGWIAGLGGCFLLTAGAVLLFLWLRKK